MERHEIEELPDPVPAGWAVVRVNDPHPGDVQLYLGDPRNPATVHQCVNAITPMEQRMILVTRGFTHVFCDTHWDRGLYTVEEYAERLRRLA